MSGNSRESVDCAAKLKALGEPLRWQIVNLLRHGDQTVGDIAESLGQDAVIVSHHLGVLHTAGILESEKRGRFVIYRIHPTILTHPSRASDMLDFGCCSLDIPKPGAE